MIRPIWDYLPRPTDDAVALSFLTRSTQMQLRRIVHAHREGWLLEDRIARVGAMVAEDAHRDEAPPTELLITVKRAWAGIDAVHALAPHDARDLLRLVVTACIHAYYADPSGSASAVDVGGAVEGQPPARAEAPRRA